MTETSSPTPPAFCSLDRDAYTQRLAQIMDLMLKFEGRVEHTANGTVLRFKRGEGLEPVLEGLIEAERSCCSTLVFDLREGRDEWALHVRMPGAALNHCC